MKKTDEILDMERACVWPPYTQAAVYFGEPHPVMERGEGVFLVDTDGKRYYDAFASWWVNLHGHGNPHLNKALTDQAEKVAHCSLAGVTHEPAVRLARDLIDIAPAGISRVFYSDDGSTAIEVAMKMAFQYFQNKGETRRTRFAAFTNAYHGDTLGAVAVGGIDLFHQVFKPTLIPVVRAPAPTCLACPHGLERATCEAQCFSAIGEALLPHADELCAILVEPLVQGAVGMHMYSPKVLAALRAFCDEHGILLIDDEVAMGFGRTGSMWACDHAGVSPDIVCAAKGLTGGYLPLAVTMTTEMIYEAFLGAAGDTRTFYHGHSFTGNPLAAAVARESLRLLREERLPELPRTMDAFSAMLDRFARYPWARNVRRCGMVGAFEVESPGSIRGPDEDIGIGRRIFRTALAEGVYIRPLGDTVYFIPPLSITPAELADMGQRVERAISKAVAQV